MSAVRVQQRLNQNLQRSIWLFAAFAVSLGGLHTILDGVFWWWQSMLVVVVMLGSAALVRHALSVSRRAPRTLAAAVLAPAAAAVGLFITLVVGFASDVSWLWLIPTKGTLDRFATLLHDVSYSITWQDVPANADPPILFLLALGTGVLVLLAEIATFSLRLPALAGIPLLALFLVPGMPPEGSTDIGFFVLSGACYLGLLLAGRRGSFVASLAIGAVAIGGAMVIPGALPSTAITAGDNGLGPSVATGVNPLLRLGDDLRDTEKYRALSYSTISGKPQYLRLVEISSFFSTNWKPNPPALDPQNRPVEFPRPPGLGTGVNTFREVTYVHVANLLSPWLPVPYPASSIIGLEGSWQFVPDGFTVASDRTLARGEDYTVSSVVVDPTPEQLLASGTRVPDNLDDYLELPPGTPKSVENTALSVTSSWATNYEKALALQEYLRSSPFRYSVSAPVTGDYDATGVEVVATFLEQKSGYCIHFASAMAVMARELGIPSRILVGFQPGTEQDREDQGRTLYEVTTGDLHAWPELYFSGIGWVRFEPTPSRGAVPDYANALLGDVPSVGDSASAPGAPGASGREPERPDIDSGPTNAGWLAGDQSSRWVGWAGLVVGIGALVLLPATVRSVRRRRALRGLVNGKGTVAAAWREVRESAEDFGIVLQTTSTPRGAIQRLRMSTVLTEPGREALDRMVPIIEAAGYGRPPAVPSLSRPGLAQDVTTVIRSLRSGADPADRLRARLLPSSLFSRATRATRRAV